MTTIADQVHPSQFSPEVLEVMAPILQAWNLPVHDPFAGPGVRLGRLCDELGLAFSGTEIEPEFIVDPRVRQGDSTTTWWDSYPSPLKPYVIVTSPVYPNGMADHFHARDDSERHTYRQALAKIRGKDRELAGNNMGRWGARSGRTAELEHFRLANSVVRHWPPAKVLLNISDFITGGKTYDLIGRWKVLLDIWDYIVTDQIPVHTRRQRKGANGDARVDHEVVLVAVPRRMG